VNLDFARTHLGKSCVSDGATICRTRTAFRSATDSDPCPSPNWDKRQTAGARLAAQAPRPGSIPFVWVQRTTCRVLAWSPAGLRLAGVLSISQIMLLSVSVVPSCHNRAPLYVTRTCPLPSFSRGRVRARARARTVASGLRRYRAKRRGKGCLARPALPTRTLTPFAASASALPLPSVFVAGGDGEQQKQPETAEQETES
jgi:hypothetical protein